MTKKILLLLILCMPLGILSGCSFKDTKEDEESIAAEDSEGGEDEGEGDEESEGDETADADEEEGDESIDEDYADAGDEASEGDAAAENADVASDASTADESSTGSDVATTDESSSSAYAEGESGSDVASNDATTESGADSTTETYQPPEPADPSATDFGSSFAGVDTGDGTSAPAPMAPYRKIEDKPFKRAGKWMNAVIVARTGDTWATLSGKLGAGEADLKAFNPSLTHRELRVGDKVYYNSSMRPADDSKIMTYYEEQGMAPEVYISRAGDNVRNLGKELLGSSQSWKELYALNSFDSKGELPEGTEIRYWKDVAGNSYGNSELAGGGSIPEPPPMDNSMMAQNDFPPPPADMGSAQAGMDATLPPPPPPPAPEESYTPPPPPPAPEPEMAMDEGLEEEEGDPMADVVPLAAIAVIVVAAAGFIIVRRRRQKESADAVFSDTQVG